MFQVIWIVMIWAATSWTLADGQEPFEKGYCFHHHGRSGNEWWKESVFVIFINVSMSATKECGSSTTEEPITSLATIWFCFEITAYYRASRESIVIHYQLFALTECTLQMCDNARFALLIISVVIFIAVLSQCKMNSSHWNWCGPHGIFPYPISVEVN